MYKRGIHLSTFLPRLPTKFTKSCSTFTDSTGSWFGSVEVPARALSFVGVVLTPAYSWGGFGGWEDMFVTCEEWRIRREWWDDECFVLAEEWLPWLLWLPCEVDESDFADGAVVISWTGSQLGGNGAYQIKMGNWDRTNELVWECSEKAGADLWKDNFNFVNVVLQFSWTRLTNKYPC